MVCGLTALALLRAEYSYVLVVYCVAASVALNAATVTTIGGIVFAMFFVDEDLAVTLATEHILDFCHSALLSAQESEDAWGRRD